MESLVAAGIIKKAKCQSNNPSQYSSVSDLMIFSNNILHNMSFYTKEPVRCHKIQQKVHVVLFLFLVIEVDGKKAC